LSGSEGFIICDNSYASESGDDNENDKDSSEGEKLVICTESDNENENLVIGTDSDDTKKCKNIVNFEDKKDGEEMLYDESIKSKSCDVNGKIEDINIDEIYNENQNDQVFTLYDGEIFINDLKNYQTWYEEESVSTVQDCSYRLFDISSEISKLGNLKNVDRKLIQRLRKALQKDLNDFLCTHQAAKLPYGKVFTFQDDEDGKWVGLVTSGVCKSWRLLTDKKEMEGDMWIEKSHTTGEAEIIFRRRREDHTLLKGKDWTYITPKHSTVIKKIRSFKKYTKLREEELQKFKRAAYIEDDENEWEYKGFYNIESGETIYDENSTLYKIKWIDQTEWDTLKNESDLAGDIEIGDRVCYEFQYGRGFGDVKDIVKVYCDDRVTSETFRFDYKVFPDEWPENYDEYKPENYDEYDLDQTLLLAPEKISYLWKKRKPVEESNATNVAEDFTEVFFEQIADVLKANDIHKRIIDHVSNEENLYMNVHPNEFLASEEIAEVVSWASENKKDVHDVKKQILRSWKKQMRGKKRTADNLSILAAQKIWNDEIKIKVLGSKTYEPRAQFSITLKTTKQNYQNEGKEKLNNIEIKEQKSNEIQDEEPKTKEIKETKNEEQKSEETENEEEIVDENGFKRKRVPKK
jgi:hypothetical protein